MNIVNISANFKLNVKINLKKLKEQDQNAKFDRKLFSGLILRFEEEKFTSTIFNSGAVIITGTKSEHETREAAYILCRRLQSYGYKDAVVKDLKIQNIVCAGKCGDDVNLEKYYEYLQKLNQLLIPSLEPELFPGLILRTKYGKESVTYFRSGKYFITGCKSFIEIKKFEQNFLLYTNTFLKKS